MSITRIEIEHYLDQITDHSDDAVRKFIIREKSTDIERGMLESNIKTVEEAVNASIETIAASSFKSIINKKMQVESVASKAAYTTAYKCRKCGGDKSTVVYVQTRSSDEPMTAFIKCIECNNQFRQ